MKLLLMARRYPPDIRSGTETVFEALYQQARTRHEVRLLVGYTRGRDLVPEEAVAVDLRQGPRPRRWAALWASAVREILRWKPDVVLSNSIEAPAVPGTPTVTIVHDLNFGGAAPSLKTRAQASYYAHKARSCARIVTVSEAMRRHLLSQGFPEEKVVAIRNGVDTRRFSPLEAAPQGTAPLVFTYPSRLLPGKGQHLAIDAVARLTPEEKRRVKLIIVGSSADPVYVDRLRVQAYGQPVEIHVDVPDIVPYYQGADVILFPTVMSEGFGFTAVEGMSCGKPVIWSDQPAIREATGAIGLPVPQGDVEALRDAIRRLLAIPAERESLGKAGRAFVEGQYDWERVWRRYETVLREAAT